MADTIMTDTTCDSVLSPSAKLSGKCIKIVPADETEPMDLPIEIAFKSTTIKNMVDDLGPDGEGIAIPLKDINKNIMEIVIKYALIHLDDPIVSLEIVEANQEGSSQEGQAKKAEEDRLKIDERDLEIIKIENGEVVNMDKSTLFEIIMAANFLDFKPLLDLSCKSAALMIKGKSPEQIRQTFNIVNDFTPEEEEAIRKENEWCEER
jgi:S-phase kinase-associated protein 1